MTEANSEYLYKSKSPVQSRDSAPITADAKRRATIINRIDALFPYLQEIMGKNDARSEEIIRKLMALRDGLDSIFETFNEDLQSLEK